MIVENKKDYVTKWGVYMYVSTMTIPQDSYGYVEKINWEFKYKDIISELLNDSNNMYNIMNNNIIGESLIMEKRNLRKHLMNYIMQKPALW